MRRRMMIAGALVVLLLCLPGGFTPGNAATAGRSGCNSKACELRVLKRQTFEKWNAGARAYGLGLLRARMHCESGGHGGYALATTGNGYWFAHQFNVGAWTGSGGRMRGGRPVGVWTRQPTVAEQDWRAVVWDRRHGGDPWPRCP
ncbi:MAG: hypothetical protein ACRDMZ_00985 [Solirubrobacteraceae bacterium]